MPAVAAVRVAVTGRVQGVGFRYATLQEAQRRGLTGWVRNLADGRVEVLAQGSAAMVEDLISWLETGPRFAAVVGIDVLPMEPDDDLSTFSVRF